MMQKICVSVSAMLKNVHAILVYLCTISTPNYIETGIRNLEFIS